MNGQRRVYTFDEDTKIPVRLAWVVAFALVSIAMSFATVLVKVENATAHAIVTDSQIEDINKDRQIRRDKLTDLISSVDRRLSRIEGKLNIPLSQEEK